jgi:hypothetical protein
MQMLKVRNDSDRAKDKRDMMVELFLRQGFNLHLGNLTPNITSM